MCFSQRLRELRLENGFTQKELSSRLGLSPNSICEWEKGRCEPSIYHLKELSILFDCPIDYILGHSDDFGNVTVYQQTDNVNSLSADEQKIIDALRRNAPNNAVEWLTMYVELPAYMQESIFAELKGMHLGYVVAKNKSAKEVK